MEKTLMSYLIEPMHLVSSNLSSAPPTFKTLNGPLTLSKKEKPKAIALQQLVFTLIVLKTHSRAEVGKRPKDRSFTMLFHEES